MELSKEQLAVAAAWSLTRVENSLGTDNYLRLHTNTPVTQPDLGGLLWNTASWTKYTPGRYLRPFANFRGF